MRSELSRLVGAEHVLEAPPGSPYNRDATGRRDIEGRADAVVLPGSAEEVATVVRWCYANDVPIETRRKTIIELSFCRERRLRRRRMR